MVAPAEAVAVRVTTPVEHLSSLMSFVDEVMVGAFNTFT
jgi:hypothetical protein